MAEKRFEFLSKVFAKVEKWQAKSSIEVDQRIPKITEELQQLEKDYLIKKEKITLLSKERKWKEILDLDIDFGSLESSISTKRDIIAEIRKNHRLTEDLGRKVAALQLFVNITYLKHYPADVKEEMLEDLSKDLTQDDIDEEIRKIGILEGMSKSKQLAPDSSGEMIITYEGEEYETGVSVKVMNLGESTIRIEALKGAILEALMNATEPMNSTQLIAYIRSQNIDFSGAFSYRIRNLNKIIKKYGYVVVNVDGSGSRNGGYELQKINLELEPEIIQTSPVNEVEQIDIAAPTGIVIYIDGKQRDFRPVAAHIIDIIYTTTKHLTLTEIVEQLRQRLGDDSLNDKQLSTKISGAMSYITNILKLQIVRSGIKNKTHIFSGDAKARIRIDYVTYETNSDLEADNLFDSTVAQELNALEQYDTSEVVAKKTLREIENEILGGLQSMKIIGATKIDLLDLLYPGKDNSVSDRRRDQDVYRAINALRKRGYIIISVGVDPVRYVLNEDVENQEPQRSTDTGKALEGMFDLSNNVPEANTSRTPISPEDAELLKFLMLEESDLYPSTQEVQVSNEPKEIYFEGRNVTYILYDKELIALHVLKAQAPLDVSVRDLMTYLQLPSYGPAYDRNLPFVVRIIRNIENKLKVRFQTTENNGGKIEYIRMPVEVSNILQYKTEIRDEVKIDDRKERIRTRESLNSVESHEVMLGFYFLIALKIFDAASHASPSDSAIMGDLYDIAVDSLTKNGINVDDENTNLTSIAGAGNNLHWYRQVYKAWIDKVFSSNEKYPALESQPIISKLKELEPDVRNNLLKIVLDQIEGQQLYIGTNGGVHRSRPGDSSGDIRFRADTE